MTSLFDLPFEEPQPEPEAEPVRTAARDRVRTVLSVTELTMRIRDLLESHFFEVWVEGEISNARVWNTGHLYFTLKDAHSQVRALMYRSTLRYLRFKPEDGLRVVARGRIGVYEPKGEYQFVCEHMEPQGLGARQLAFEQLKKRLEAEGLFDRSRKRVLPSLPRKIGIVTSTDGAAVRDILKVLGRRYPNAHVVIKPSRVQGEGAGLEIARGIRAISGVAGVDVVIVARGGGSIEDLWTFNEEVVARAIAACPVPLISAVGHEVDVTIADFVADLRAPTPSAAAELVIARRDDFRQSIDRLGERALALVRQRPDTPPNASPAARAPAGFRWVAGPRRPASPTRGRAFPPVAATAPCVDRAARAPLSDHAVAARELGSAPPPGSHPHTARRSRRPSDCRDFATVVPRTAPARCTRGAARRLEPARGAGAWLRGVLDGRPVADRPRCVAGGRGRPREHHAQSRRARVPCGNGEIRRPGLAHDALEPTRRLDHG